MSDNESEKNQAEPTGWDASTAFSSNGSDPSDSAPADGMDLDDRTKFLTDLTAVMQTTAASEKARNGEITEARRKTHIDSIRAREAMEAEELRELAKEDVKGIDAWSEGEIKRIKLERERRIASRREQLQIRLEEHRSVISREVEGVEGAVAAYRVEMDDFFTRLGNQTDPVEFARQAGSQPAFPDLARAGAPEPAPTADYGYVASAPVAEAVAEAPYQAPEPEPVVEAPTADAYQEPAEPVSEDVAVAQTETEPIEQAYEAPVEPVAEAQPEQTYEAPAEQTYEAPAEQTYEAPVEPVYEAPIQEAEPVQEAPAEESIPVEAQGDQGLIGVMDPDAGGRSVETPWESGVVDEQPQEAEPVVAEAQESGETAAEPEPEPVAAGEQVVMPRSSGAGSWLRWPSSSVDRSDPNH